MISTVKSFPRQKLSFKKKTKVWRKEHLDWADKNSRLNSETIRKSMRDKKICIDFFNGRVHKDDIKLVLNPNNLEKFYVPNKIQHYPIVTPRINVLVGEESSRRFDYRVSIVNPTGISTIENNKKKMVDAKLQELLTMNYSDEELEAEMQKFQYYTNFEWQDIREKRANMLLKHYVKELKVKETLSKGFQDALIFGEEAFLCDIRNGNPVFEKLNPLKTYVIRHGYSNRYQDADIIVVDDYWSPGKVVDTYYDQLKGKDVEYIENNGVTTTNSGRRLDGDLFKEDIDDREGIELLRSQLLDSHLDIVSDNTSGFSTTNDYFDTEGNVRVLRIYWRSYKKIFKVNYFDEQGDPQVKYRNENYIVDKNIGENSEPQWVTQWWQGTKIGKDVYVDMRPRPIQYNKIGDPGYNSPGVVGRIFNHNDQKVVSMLDRAKQFNILYDAAWQRLLEAYAKWLGPILELDKAKFPEGWGVEKTLYFAKKAGVLVVDSFKEGKKGQSTGKLAGVIGNTTGKMMQSDISSYITGNINMMEYAKGQMDEIMGVPKQRLGAVENRETLGGVEHAIRQSNYVTEPYFKEHDSVKAECLVLLLETAKIALRGNRIKAMNIGDDLTNQIMDIEGDDLIEEDHGLMIDNDADAEKLEQKLDSLAQAALQNQTLSFSTIMKMFTSPSLVEVQRMIEKDEMDGRARAKEAEDNKNKIVQQANQELSAREDRKIDLEEFGITERSRIEELKLMVNSEDKLLDRDVNNSDENIGDLDERKFKKESELKVRALDDDMTKHKDNLQVKKSQLTIKKTTPMKK